MNGELKNSPLYTIEEVPQLLIADTKIANTSLEGTIVHSYPESLTRKISSIDDLFPEQRYDKRIQKAKELLGPLSGAFTADQLKDIVTEIQFLCESWLDDFEQTIFNGLTLKELLHEKGGV